MSELGARAVSVLGLAAFVAIAWLLSADRRAVPWRTIFWGLGIQLALALLLLGTITGRAFFVVVNSAVAGLLAYTDAGVAFVFGALAETGFSFAVNVLPIIVFMGSFFSVLHHWGVVQRVVDALGVALARTLRTSGAESLAAAANIFVGMAEAPLLIRPYLERMTRSELFALMTTGMATIAGSVLVAYASILGGEYAGHLVTASLLSAPAGLVIAKVMVPETETPETGGGARVRIERPAANFIDAAAIGALAGLRLAAYVGAMLVAFVAGIALVNDALAAAGSLVGVADLTLQRIFGLVLAPLAWLMGVPAADAQAVGSLLGLKTVLNEFLAYEALARQLGELSPRSAVIASYALCGFANFGSLAILLGGIGGLAPSRRGDVARLGLRSIVSGTLATMMTGCIAGIFV